jgi:PAS domain S-box-containing protein
MIEETPSTVLIAEADEGAGLLQKRCLERDRLAVLTASSVEAALTFLGQSVVDIIVLDFRLAEKAGLDCLARIRETSHDIPVILTAEFSEHGSVIRALESGARDFILKSSGYLDYLPTVVQRVLRSVRIERQLGELEARVTSIFNSVRDAILVTDPLLQITLVNPSAQHLFRCSADALVGQPLTGLVQVEGTIDPLDALVRGMCWGVRIDGERFPVEASVSPTMMGGGRFHTIFLRDISEKHRAEQSQQAQYAVTRIIAEAATFQEAAPRMLRSIADTIDCSVGEVWLVDSELNVLHRVAAWQAPELSAADFLNEGEKLLVAPGAGLLGRVWRQGESLWVPDLTEQDDFLREAAAAEAGLRSAQLFPIRLRARILGVMGFFSRHSYPPDLGIEDMMAILGSSIGQFIERNRAEEALKRSVHDLGEAQLLAHLGNWRWKLLRNILRGSEELCRIFGLRPGEFGGTIEAAMACILPNDWPEVHAAVERALTTGEPFTVSHRIRRPDGAVRFIQSRGKVITDARGNPIAMVGTAQDLTEAWLAEERIREQAALLDKASDAIVVENLEDTILYWNQSAEHLYGWKASEAIGRKTDDLLYRQPPANRQQVRSVLAEKGEWVGELEQTTRDGREIIVESRWTRVLDPDGRPRTRLMLNTDITERKRVEAQYLRAQRMESLGTLAGGIAHDLNNVLTPIMMSVEFLKMPLEEAERLSVLSTLQASAERGAEMVRQVLSFARGVDGQRLSLQLRHVVRDLEKMLRQTFPKSIVIQSELPSNLWTITGDATQLYQVLMNLCVNARDAMPQGGRLTLAAENVPLDVTRARLYAGARPGPYVLLRVTDNGTGIAPEILDKIFDPFFTTKEAGRGTGLGLSTVLGIVKSHGGFVHVYSEPGKGRSSWSGSRLPRSH